MGNWLGAYRKYKFLPLTLVFGVLALALRIQVTEHDAQKGLFISTTYVKAQDSKPSGSDAKTPDTKPADTKTADSSAPAAAPADAKPTDSASSDPLNPDNQKNRPSEELTLLHDLADRRAALEKREADLNDREALLTASQKQFDEKLKQLTDLRNEIKQLLDQANSKQDDETKRLVDVYEKMKPKDAADIFGNMSMEILLPIAQNMKEAKLSPILAAMPPDKARQLTGTLYERAKILPQETAIAAANVAPNAVPGAPQTAAATPPQPAAGK